MDPSASGPNNGAHEAETARRLGPSYRPKNDEDPEAALETVTPVSSATSVPNPHSLADSFRRPSFFAMGGRPTVVPHGSEQEPRTEREWEQGMEEERNLLVDNGLMPAFPRRRVRANSAQQNVTGLLSHALRQTRSAPDEETAVVDGGTGIPEETPGETTALLGDDSLTDTQTAEVIDKKWEEAVSSGLIHTSYAREAKVLTKYTLPLTATFLLQYSISVASIFTVGHLGKVELGAVSLASMTASITGYGVFNGLATSLDTLCGQAYGSGRKDLVGIHLQRAVFFLWAFTVPIAIIWLLSDKILVAMVPEEEVARLAGLYLKVVLLGAPGYAAFEAGKRFVYAQGLFSVSLYVLLLCAPLNALMHWLFVWQFNWGFVGAPIAVAVTDNLLPLTLFLYVYFGEGMECWGGFSRRALRNWGPMVRLSLPGLVMVEAEVLAFEILTLAASYFGTTALAAQSVLASVCSITFQVPFTLSIAGSTRIANLIGAGLPDAARTSAKVSGAGSLIIGLANAILLSALREYIPILFTSDMDVAQLVAAVLPLTASFQLFDSCAAVCNGILRGLGYQSIGGYVQLFCYYCIAIPVSMGTAFRFGWGLWGLWTGVAIGLLLVGLIEGIFLSRTSWENAVRDARARSSMG